MECVPAVTDLLPPAVSSMDRPTSVKETAWDEPLITVRGVYRCVLVRLSLLLIEKSEGGNIMIFYMRDVPL